jgi:YidC/Oxa1 family membrane protein insertase
LLDWLYTAVSWVLLRWHDVFSQFLSPSGGFTWVLSIAFLVITLRIVLFPLFVKQMHSMRAMQKMAPQMAEIKRKYKDDRQAQTQAMMKLQKEAGVNPLGGCLPLLIQSPVFLALYHVLRHLQPGRNKTLYGWTTDKFDSVIHAKFLGAPLPASFKSSAETLKQFDNADPTTTKIVIVVLLLLSCAATFITQKHNQLRNKTQPEGQAAVIQKFMVYVLPFGLLFTGLVFAFPLGVLIYWVTNNFWTMGQQFYIYQRIEKKEAAEAAAIPVIDPASLAPRPGQRPPRDTRGRQVTGRPAIAEANSGGSGASIPADDRPASGSKPAGGRSDASRARPGGNRPQRGGGPKNSPQRKKKPR